MRHTDARLSTQNYSDPRLLDTARAVDRLPALTDDDKKETCQTKRTGTDDQPVDARLSLCMSDQRPSDDIPCHRGALDTPLKGPKTAIERDNTMEAAGFEPATSGL